MASTFSLDGGQNHLPSGHGNDPEAGLHNVNTITTIYENGNDNVSSGASLGKTRSSAIARHYNIRSALGLHATAPIDEVHNEHPHQDLFWSRVRVVLREPFCEFWGVFIMVMFGDGSVAQVLLSGGLTATGGSFGSYQSISWG